MPLKPDPYLERIDIEKYLPQGICKKSCGFTFFKEWLHILQEWTAQTAPRKQITSDLGCAVEVVFSLNAFLPEIEITQHPVSGILTRQDQNHPYWSRVMRFPPRTMCLWLSVFQDHGAFLSPFC